MRRQPKTRSTLIHLSASDAPRDHYYQGYCSNCTWFEDFGQAPLKAQKETKTHARRAAGHSAYVLDFNTLSEVARYAFERLDLYVDGDQKPPF